MSPAFKYHRLVTPVHLGEVSKFISFMIFLLLCESCKNATLPLPPTTPTFRSLNPPPFASRFKS